MALDDANLSAVHAALDAAVALAVSLGAPPADAILAELEPAATSWRGCEASAELRGAGAAAGAAETADLDPGAEAGGDAELCRRDLLGGWLKMGLAERLRYLAEVADLEPAARQHALTLLCMAARGSPARALTICRTPRLLPLVASMLRCGDADAASLALALSLVQLLASSGRESALPRSIGCDTVLNTCRLSK